MNIGYMRVSKTNGSQGLDLQCDAHLWAYPCSSWAFKGSGWLNKRAKALLSAALRTCGSIKVTPLVHCMENSTQSIL